MNNLTVKGKQSFMGKEIPVVLGGFGPSQKCICDKTIAEIHGMRIADIRRRITDNISHFRENIDCIDLLKDVREAHDFTICSQLGYTRNEISRADHIYILSERGYGKLIKIMDTDQAWEIYENLQDQYFDLRDGDSSSIKKVLAEAAAKRATAMDLNSKTRAFKAIMGTFDGSKYSPVAVEVFGLHALEQVTGKKIDYRPEFGESWTATDIQKETGLCASTIGKIAKAAGLKIEQYGKAILNHVPGQDKQVPEFHYNVEGHQLLLAACEKWKADHAKKPHKNKKSNDTAATA